MARFKVILGKHWDVNGKEYKKGDIIESNKDLTKVFPNKFEIVLGDAPSTVKVPAPVPVLPVTAPVAPVIPVPPAPVAAPAPVPAPIAPVPAPAPVVLPVPPPPVAPAAKKQTALLGTDISDRFPTAIKAHLKVFRRGKDYAVAEESQPDVALNDKPLTKALVDEFIRLYDEG